MTCAHCGDSFQRPYPATYCSHRCVALARHAREARTQPTKDCAFCDSQFSKNPRYNADQWERARFCSRPCQFASKRMERVLCACGCGQRVSKPRSRYCQGHNTQTERLKTWQLIGPEGKRRWCVAGRGGKRVLWARIVMQNELERPLLDSEVVHHINGDSMDDRPENLQLFPSHSEHMRHEWRQWQLEGKVAA